MFTILMEIGLLILVGIGLILCFHFYFKRSIRKESDLVKFKGFTPEELRDLQDRGLLSDEESKRLQQLMAEKTIESLEERKNPKEPRMDLQELLSTAENLKRSAQKEKESSLRSNSSSESSREDLG
jgi:hypothetical protein